tara:strand:+ start:484 stop:1209 length:726 start_codon:yes stop_codon:yes gene_type:complete
MSNLFKEIEFQLNSNEKYVFKKKSNSFIPTGTTNLLLNAILDYNPKPGNVLDLGAGIGIIGILLNYKNIALSPVCLSDVNENSLECINKNAEIYNSNVIAKEGSLFEPWTGFKFDIIVNDVSGIASKIANLSSWFKNVPCDSGEDGTKLTVKIIRESKNYLNNRGLLFLPIISLSNKDKIIGELEANYTNVKLLKSQEWPLPKEISNNEQLLNELEGENKIYTKSKFGMKIFETSIYMAHN